MCILEGVKIPPTVEVVKKLLGVTETSTIVDSLSALVTAVPTFQIVRPYLRPQELKRLVGPIYDFT